MNCRYLFPAAALLLALGLTGCATTITYIPTDDNARMSLIKARRVLAWNNSEVVNNKTLVMRTVLVGRTWIPSLSLPLKDLKVVAGSPGAMAPGMAGVNSVLEFPGSGYSRVCVGHTMYSVQQMAEAIYIVKRQAEREGFQPRDAEAEFEKAAVAYLAAAVKPELDEDTRRLKVQAEDALREKRFEDVADFYGEALEIAPWWPAGHYNRALVLSELKEYPDAVVEMKRYLRLAPDAENTRAAQDEIYKWEAKVPKRKKK
jgi:tetratricopeptide (TPR) repeat protein